MEKFIPHYSLEQIKDLIQARRVKTTRTALLGANALGINYDQMLMIIFSLTRHDFYKSMTTYADHQVWQDVYRPHTDYGQIYIKLTILDDLLIVSFKEK